MFLPFINRWLNSVIENDLKRFIIVTFSFVTILPIFMQSDPFKFSNGYSMIWIMLLCILGAYIKKFVDLNRISSKKFGITYFLVVLILWTNKLVVELIMGRIASGLENQGEVFIKYNSILYVC